MNLLNSLFDLMRRGMLFLGLAAGAGVICAGAATVTRGPYLQQGTTNSVVVRWRTDVATDSLVRYGLSPDALNGLASDASLVTEHIVLLSGLQMDTRYYYQFGSSGGWFAADTNNYFFTSPPMGVPKPIRIWAIGDAGTATTEQMAVRDAYTLYNGTRRTDLWLMLGDNAYDTGLDIQYQAAVFNMYPAYLQNIVVWPTLGNHDASSTGPNGVNPYFDIFTLPQNGEAGGVPSGTEHYYSFDYANIHFICLDSAGSNRGTNGAMCNWLRSDLAATTQDWVIPFWHHPPYTKGSHDSDAESNLIEVRQNMIPILESYGVDLVLCGHSHSYERSFLLDGHYGFSGTLTPTMKVDGGDGREEGTGAYHKQAGRPGPNQGVVYTVAGSSGHTGGGTLNHPAMFISLDVLGSLVIDINSNRLDMAFIEPNAVVGDHFTLLKAPPPTNAPVAPTNLIATAISSSQIVLTWSDASDNEAGFKLERSTNGVDFGQIAVLAAGVTNQTDSGLAAATNYYYQVRAFNAAGNSPYSAPAQATTLAITNGSDIVPPAAVTNLLVGSVTSNSATLNWTAPGDDGNLGRATLYDVRYSTTLITDANWASASQASGEPAPATAGAAESFTVKGLAAGTTYYFGLKTSDEANNPSPLSNVPNAATTAATNILNPPLAPAGLRAVAVATNEIDLNWTDNAGNEDGFKVERATNGLNFVQITTVGANVTNLADRGVQQGTLNYYRVRAFNAAGNSPYSNTNSAQALTPGGTISSILIASNAVWKYLDNGSNQSNAWTGLTFNDSAWASGAAILGYAGGHETTTVSYGPNSSAKYITTYFRRHFTVSDPSSVSALTVSVLRDDGAVVYLNGQDVFRSNMPTGAVDYLTPAPLSVSGTDKTSFHDSPPIDPGSLLAGDNIMAVELHQHSGNSSSMDFALQLTSTNRLAPPVLVITLSPIGQVSLQWSAYSGKTYRIQYASDPTTNVWATLGNDVIANGSTASATNAIGSIRQRFYRVLRMN